MNRTQYLEQRRNERKAANPGGFLIGQFNLGIIQDLPVIFDNSAQWYMLNEIEKEIEGKRKAGMEAASILD